MVQSTSLAPLSLLSLAPLSRSSPLSLFAHRPLSHDVPRHGGRVRVGDQDIIERGGEARHGEIRFDPRLHACPFPRLQPPLHHHRHVPVEDGEDGGEGKK